MHLPYICTRPSLNLRSWTSERLPMKEHVFEVEFLFLSELSDNAKFLLSCLTLASGE